MFAGQGPPFSRLLIANRGEIAVRIADTCRTMGIRSIAVYSTADRDALHAQVADEAYEIGPAPASQSYLNIPAILAVAGQVGADALHPGYGFLAENAEFARAVIAAGIAWIGPSPDVIALLGDKVAAKDLAGKAGVLPVPGYAGDDQSAERLAEEAERIGYPVMLKAAAGGGGRGMRSVTGVEELASALESAQREALAAFGDQRVFLEKLIAHPRHVEIQVLVDGQGSGIFLGERDCSLQRRHQKVVEEAPCPILSPSLRARMGEDALRLVLAAGYTNAGTVEFLLADEHYHFLEVNTRIQVEHPVTEAVTGMDLIRCQIEIAAGLPLSVTQAQVSLAGHAIEARVYAEDPETGFLPSTGRLQTFVPPEGLGVRNDIGVYQGFTVSPYYDSMLAKLTVHARTRSEALDTMQRALTQYRIAGVQTNLAFLRWLVSRPEFETGLVDVEFIDREWVPTSGESEETPFEIVVGAVLAVLTGTSSPARRAELIDPWQQASAWRPFGMARQLLFRAASGRIEVEAIPIAADTWTVRSGNQSMTVGVLDSPPSTIALRTSAGQPVSGCRNLTMAVTWDADTVTLGWTWRAFSLQLVEVTADLSRSRGGAKADRAIAPMPGTIVKIAVEVGQSVGAHQPLVVLEAMKMEHVVEAPHAGTVRAVLVGVGDLVAAGAVLVELEEP